MTATIQDVERYWDRQPCNVRHGQAPVGTPKWSQEVSRRKFFVEPHIAKFADFERWRGKKVLDLGCGIGTQAIQFAIAGAWVVDGLDLSSQSIKLAYARGTFPIRYFRADAEYSLEWLQNKYDLVWCFGMLHHTPRPERVLANIFQVLKPDGELRMMVYAKWSIKYLLRQQLEAQAGCPVAHVYTVHQVRRMLVKQGLEVVSIRKTHIFPYQVPDYVQHRYVKHWYYSWMPRPLFTLLERLLGWHLLVVARRKEAA